jgi:hypothetical protein
MHNAHSAVDTVHDVNTDLQTHSLTCLAMKAASWPVSLATSRRQTGGRMAYLCAPVRYLEAMSESKRRTDVITRWLRMRT